MNHTKLFLTIVLFRYWFCFAYGAVVLLLVFLVVLVILFIGLREDVVTRQELVRFQELVHHALGAVARVIDSLLFLRVHGCLLHVNPHVILIPSERLALRVF
jgi:hypothetical protein